MQLELRLIILLIGLVIIGLIYFWGMRRQRNRRRSPSRWSTRGARSDAASSVLDENASVDSVLGSSAEAELDLDLASGLSGKLESSPEPVPPSSAAQPSERSSRPPPRPTGEPVVVPSATANPQPAVPAVPLSPAEPAAKPAPTPVPEPAIAPATAKIKAEFKLDFTADVADEVNVVLLVKPAAPHFEGPVLLETFLDNGYELGPKETWSYKHEGVDAPLFNVGHLKEPGTFDLNGMDTLQTPGLLLFMSLPGPLKATAAVDHMLDAAVVLAEQLGGSVCGEEGHPMTLDLQNSLRAEAAAFELQHG